MVGANVAAVGVKVTSGVTPTERVILPVCFLTAPVDADTKLWIDVSGEGAEIELEEQKPENEVETKEEDSSPAPQVEETREEKAEGSDAQPEAKQEEKPEQKKEELETYSKDVQRRIAKLTKNGRHRADGLILQTGSVVLHLLERPPTGFTMY